MYFIINTARKYGCIIWYVEMQIKVKIIKEKKIKLLTIMWTPNELMKTTEF